MKNQKNIRTIDRYLRKELSEEEMIDMEVRLLEDAAFRKEFNTVKTLLAGIKASAQQSTFQEKLDRLKRPKLQPVSKKTIEPGATVIALPQSRRAIFYRLGYAVLLAMLIAAILPLMRNPTPAQMFASTFEVSPNLDYRTARGAEIDAEIATAYRAYDQGQYAQAALLLEGLVEESNDPLIHQFYLGNCYLTMDKWPQAIAALRAPAHANFHLSDDAKWYLGLAYLGSGDTKSAIPLLKDSSRALERERKARKLLRMLER